MDGFLLEIAGSTPHGESAWKEQGKDSTVLQKL